MYTIIQKQPDNSFNVVAKVYDKDVATELTCVLCDNAGVVRTVCLDEFGYAVSGES